MSLLKQLHLSARPFLMHAASRSNATGCSLTISLLSRRSLMKFLLPLVSLLLRRQLHLHKLPLIPVWAFLRLAWASLPLFRFGSFFAQHGHRGTLLTRSLHRRFYKSDPASFASRRRCTSSARHLRVAKEASAETGPGFHHQRYGSHSHDCSTVAF